MQTRTLAPSALSEWLSHISRERVLAHTRTLCDLPFAGRRVGTEGHERASAWLIQQLRQEGWEVTTHPFSLTMPVLEVSAPLQFTQRSAEGELIRTLHHRTKFCEHPRSAFHSDLAQGTVMPLSETGDHRGAWVVLVRLLNLLRESHGARQPISHLPLAPM